MTWYSVRVDRDGDVFKFQVSHHGEGNGLEMVALDSTPALLAVVRAADPGAAAARAWAKGIEEQAGLAALGRPQLASGDGIVAALIEAARDQAEKPDVDTIVAAVLALESCPLCAMLPRRWTGPEGELPRHSPTCPLVRGCFVDEFGKKKETTA